MIVRELISRLGFEADETKVKSFDARVEKLTSTLKSTIKWGAAAAGALSGVIAKSFIQNTMDAEAEQAQLASVLRSTGEAAGFTIDKLNKMADALQRNSALDGGEITKAQTALLAFTGIAGDEFVKASQAAVDMASRTGMSVVSAAEVIGRALDVPSAGMSALSKQGFRFTEQEKKLVKQLEKTGQTARAQGLILKALETTYGGAAKAASQTFGGTLARLRETIKSLLTGDSGSLEGLRKSIENLIDRLSTPEAKKSVDDLVNLVISFAIEAGKLAGKLIDLVQEMGGAEKVAKALAYAFGALIALKVVGWVLLLRDAFILLTAAMVLNPIGLIAVAISVVVVGVTWLIYKLYTLMDSAKEISEAIGSFFVNLADIIKATLWGTFSLVIDNMMQKWQGFKDFIGSPINGIVNMVSGTSSLPSSSSVATQARSGMSRSPINMNVRNDVKISVPTGTTQEQTAAINSQVERQMRSVLAREVGAASLALEGM